MRTRSLIKSVLPDVAYRRLRKVRRDTLRTIKRFRSIEVLPHADFTDRIVHQRQFVRSRGREPSETSMLLSDYLFRMKTGPEITSPLRVRISDKEHVKDYVCERIGDEHNVPTIAVLRSYQEAFAFKYPNRCVIKPTHASCQVILRRNGEPIDFEKIDFWFDLNYYHFFRERNYRALTPKVIVEPFVFDRDEVSDFKVFCWRGIPRMIQVDAGRFNGHERVFFDVDWMALPFSMKYPLHTANVPRPACLAAMLDVASKLSAPFSFIRVDFYLNGTQMLVGELTNCPEAGNVRFRPKEAEAVASRLIFGADFH